LQAARFDVHLAHSFGMKAMRKRKRVKTDARDAYELSNLLRLGSLPETYIAPPELREFRELVRHRRQLTRTATSVKAQIRALLAKHGVRLPAKPRMAWTVNAVRPTLNGQPANRRSRGGQPRKAPGWAVARPVSRRRRQGALAALRLDAQRWLDEVTTSLVTGQYVDPKAGRVTPSRRSTPSGPPARSGRQQPCWRWTWPPAAFPSRSSLWPSSAGLTSSSGSSR
jgi:hypothetical protein